MSRKLRVFEAFAGVGSQAMALRNIGVDYEVVGISEVDRYGLIAYDAIHTDDDNDITDISKEDMINEIEDKHICYNFSTYKSEIPRGMKDLIKVYNAHKRSKNYGDICLIDANKLPDIDIFTYSYPCKNVSAAGKQAGLAKGSGTQSSLVWECEKIVKAKKIPVLLMENVKNLVGKAHKPHFDEWCEVLEGLGYNNYWAVLNAKDFRLPQNRERVMMVSILKEYDGGFKMPEGSELTVRLKDILDSEVEEKYYVPDTVSKDLLGRIKKEGVRGYKDDLKPNRLGGMFDKPNGRHQAGSVWDKNCISPTIDTMQGGYRMPCVIEEVVKVEYKGEEVELPCACASRGRNPENPNLRVAGLPTVQMLELNTKGVSNSLTTVQKDNYLLETDLRVRKFKPIECWRLQGFSDEDYYKAENKGLSHTKLYERAGRGIPVPMLEDLFKSIFDSLVGIEVNYKNKE